MMTDVAWGLVGAGDVARKRVAAALSNAPNSHLLAVSRRNAEELAAFAREFNIERTYEDWRDLVSDPYVTAVYIATPVFLHAEMAAAAAAAGKHVLCEKPMALSVAECERMMTAAAEAGVTLGVAYYRHFYPVLNRIKEMLAQGVIGIPVLAQVNAFEQFDPGPDHPRAWLLDEEKAGGGPLYDFGCHRIEVLLNLFGSIADVTGRVDEIAFRRDVEDTAVAVMRHQDGPLAVLSVSHGPAEPRDSLDIFGTDGSIHVPVLNDGDLRVLADGRSHSEQHPPADNLHQPLIEQFVRAASGVEAAAVDGGVGREVNRLLELITAEST